MEKGTKKQHFVPQLLLRRFANASEQLWVYDVMRDQSFPSNVRNAGHQNNFLSMPELDGDKGAGGHFEPFFQAFEGPAVEALRQIDAGLKFGIKAIDAETRAALAHFIAIQHLRTPAARESMVQATDACARVEALEIAQRNNLDTSESTGHSHDERVRRTNSWRTETHACRLPT